MLAAVQALIAPLLATVQARIALTASLLIRRAAFVFAAALFGVGALMFLSVGTVFALAPRLGTGGALLLMAGIWAVLAVACLAVSRPRPAAVAAAAAPAVPPPPGPAAAPWPAGVPAGYPPAPSHGVQGVSPAPATTKATSRTARLRARVSRAAPLLAIGALVAGIIAGRR